MLHNTASAATNQASLNPASYAAGANNGSWVDITKVKGEAMVPYTIGALTGSVIIKVQDATDIAGTGSADLTGVVTAALSVANSAGSLRVPANNHRGFVRVVATVTTGPIFIGASVAGHPGNV
jgi:hypothetical protein